LEWVAVPVDFAPEINWPKLRPQGGLDVPAGRCTGRGRQGGSGRAAEQMATAIRFRILVAPFVRR
jgi:hypothetical protein